MGCKTISFREGSQHSEDWDFDAHGNSLLNETVTLYPPRTADSKGLGDDKHYLCSRSSSFSRNTRLQLRQLLDAVRELTTPPDPPKRPIGFVTHEDKKDAPKQAAKAAVKVGRGKKI